MKKLCIGALVLIGLIPAALCAQVPTPARADEPVMSACRSPAARVHPPARADEPPVDAAYTEAIRDYTTDPKFSSPLVDSLPASAGVESPLAFLGYAIGAPGKLSRTDKIHAYFRCLEAQSDRVKVFPIGQTEEDREMIVAAISEKANLDRLEDWKQANHARADPRRTDESTAHALIDKTPLLYYVTAGLHSAETGPPEMVMELAYRLAVSETPLIREIRENVVLLLTPVLEPDGRDRQVDWFYRFLKDVKSYDDSPRRRAPYWGKYVYHDNNRDGIQQTQALTRNFVRAFMEYLPTVLLDLHESVPLLYVSLGTGPYNDSLDPTTIGEWQMFSSYEVAELAKYGMPGVWTWGFYDGWYPGYLFWVANNHNGVGRFYETFGNSNANPLERRLDAADAADAAGKPVTSRQWDRAWPPEKKFRWSMRDNANYMETGVLTSLHYAAKHRRERLGSFWEKGVRAVRKGRTEAPYAWVLPREQRDPAALRTLLTWLRNHAIELHQTTGEVKLGEKTYPAGTYVVRMDQPYRNLAKNLLEVQRFPKDAQLQPYDDVAWTLGLLLGVETEGVDDKAALAWPIQPWPSSPDDERPHIYYTGPPGNWSTCYLPNKGQSWLLALRLALQAVQVRTLRAPLKLTFPNLPLDFNREIPAGSLVFSRAELVNNLQALEKLLAAYPMDLEFVVGDPPPEEQTYRLDAPRLAVFTTFAYTQDAGWTRFTLDRMGISYALINKDYLRAGGLKEKFDVILVPNQGRLSGKDMVHEHDPKWGPMPFTQTAAFPSHGTPDSSPDITGGMGWQGLANLQKFVEEGGLVLLEGSAGRLASDVGLVRDVELVQAPELKNPGSEVRVKVRRRDHPIAYGYAEVTSVFRTDVPLYKVPRHLQKYVVVQYGTKKKDEDEKPAGAQEKKEPPEDLVLSGQVWGEDKLAGEAAILDVPHGKGRVVLYSFKPLHRFLNHSDFAFLFNAILYWNHFPP